MKSPRSLSASSLCFALVFSVLGACASGSGGSEGGSGGHLTGGSGGSSGTGGKAGSGGGSGGSGGSAGASAGSGGSGSGDAGSGGTAGGDDAAGGSAANDAAVEGDVAADDSGAAPAGDGGSPSASGSDNPPACVKMTMVADAAALTTALAAAQPGDCLVAADGAYGALTVTAKGTEAAPIQVLAANKLKATATALKVADSANVVVQGFAVGTILIANSNHARVTRCQVRGGPGIWVRVEEQKGCSSGCTNTPPGTSDYARIDHCDIGAGSSGSADVINPTGLSTNVKFDHNYVHDVTGDHIMTVGCCGPMYDYHDTNDIIELNLFSNVKVGSAEMLSIKSSASTFRYNTVLSHGGDVDIRAGKHDYIYGNYILGPGGGIRMYEDDHKIYNNYVVAGTAINLGAANGIHAGVKNATIVFNTLIGGITLNGSGNTFTDNIVIGGGGSGTGNLNGTADALGLMKMGDIYQLTAMSKAIGAGTGSFPFVMDDIAGHPRVKPDVGAEQYSTDPTLRRVLTPADVGPDAP